MTVSYIAALKTTRMQAVINAIDAGTAGTLEMGTAGMGTVLVTFSLNKPSFSLSGDTITMIGAPKFAAASATGTAANARIRSSTGSVIVSGLTIDTAGADINLNDTNIVAGQNVTLSSFSITHAP
jgi:hypothetical protein